MNLPGTTHDSVGMITFKHLHSSPRRLRAWLRAHRPLAWVDALTPDYTRWSPDPPVMERLIR